jgi:hypothetical protein
MRTSREKKVTLRTISEKKVQLRIRREKRSENKDKQRETKHVGYKRVKLL